MNNNDRKIKILRIINRFNIGGPSYNAAYLSKYLPEEFETKIIGGVAAKGEASSEYLFKELALEPIIIPEMSREISLLKDYAAYKKIRKIIKEYQPDIVHTHASKAGLLGRMAAKKEKVPFVFHTFHGNVFNGYYGKTKTQFFIFLERYLAKKSTKIIAISPSQKDDLVNKYKIAKADKFEVIPLGLDLKRFNINKEQKREIFRKKYDLNDEVAIGIIGRLAPIKNHKLFVHSIAELKKLTNQPFRAFIIGDGTEKEHITQFINNSGLTYSDLPQEKTDFTFTSWEKDVSNILPGLDIVALTSISEGTPLSLIEAQAAGIPIVSTDAGGTRDIMQNGKTGFIAASDEKDFAQKLEKLASNPALRSEMGNVGKHFTQSKFDYSNLIENTHQFYKQYF